jgi:hypothetical protein
MKRAWKCAILSLWFSCALPNRETQLGVDSVHETSPNQNSPKAYKVYDGQYIHHTPTAEEVEIAFGHKHAFFQQTVGYQMTQVLPSIAGFQDGDLSKIRSIQWEPQLIGPGINEWYTDVGDFSAVLDQFAAAIKGDHLTGYETYIIEFGTYVGSSLGPEEAFAYYEKAMKGLREEFPNSIFVHATWPVMEDQPWQVDVNTFRGRYNSLLYARYQNQEPIFDAADIEATQEDGSRCTFLEPKSQTRFPVLCPGDEKNFDPAAKRLAKVFLFMLQDLYTPN